MMKTKDVSPEEMAASHLFRAIMPHIKSIGPNELLFQLCVASRDSIRPDGKVRAARGVDLNAPDVNMAMTWSNTAQQDIYWQRLHNEYKASRQRDPE